MSIGQIITTAQGMAVVVEVLPTSVNLGNEALRQVVAEPLTGGPPPPVPAVPTVPGEQPLTPYQAIMAQAAAAYVAFVATQLDLEEWSLAAGTGGSAAAPSNAYSAAAQAYQSAQNLTGQPGPRIVVVG